MRDDELLSTLKNYIIPGKAIIKTPQTRSTKCYSIAAINIFMFHYISRIK